MIRGWCGRSVTRALAAGFPRDAELTNTLRRCDIEGTLYLGYPVLVGADTKIFVDAMLVSSRRPQALLRSECSRGSSMGFVSESQVRTRLPAGGGSLERTRLSLNSLLAGKIQGISSALASVPRIRSRNGHYNQCLTSKFPTQRNRELIGPYQGIKSAYQGSFLPDQGRVPWLGSPLEERDDPSSYSGGPRVRIPFCSAKESVSPVNRAGRAGY